MGFKLKSLDNFYESNWLIPKDTPGLFRSSLHDMRECSREDVERYFESVTQELKNGITAAKGELVAAQRRLAVYKKRASEFLTQLTTS
ncbi:MAG: hypothetical protein AAB792_00075 [Patescibacteria group bacterium]